MEESAQTPTSTAAEQPMRWRTEPEIDESRQQELAARRGVVSSIARGVYPFRGIVLGRADIEWLLATHDGSRKSSMLESPTRKAPLVGAVGQ
jgi:hypothetical protein